jgi:hypothetical protein
LAAAEVNLSIEVQGDEIVVTLHGTSYVVTYYRAAAFPQQLLTKSHSREDEGARMTQAEFHAHAWKAASPRREHWGGSSEKVWCRRQQDAGPPHIRAQDIVVTMPGTSLRVVYRKPHRGSQLVARLDYFQDQQKGPITRAEFLTRALKGGQA